jgi:hypothetical protein
MAGLVSDIDGSLLTLWTCELSETLEDLGTHLAFTPVF